MSPAAFAILSLVLMASTNSVLKFILLALLVVCALHVVQASEAASGRALLAFYWICRCHVCIRVALLYLVAFWCHHVPTSCFAGGSDRGRALLANVVGCDGANVDAQCPSGFYYLCSEGSAKGGCRSQAQGPFPDADCQRQCHTT